jgi:1-acyl-sn-glycerol-3-phosphate acyltransferase
MGFGLNAALTVRFTNCFIEGDSLMVDEPAVESRGLTRRVVRWIVRRYYGQIEVSGGDRIPQTGPVLLCANHANSLVDPVLIGVAAHRPVRFMAKAPLFDHPLLGPPMSALGMIPVYRGSDEGSDIRKNFESLDVGAKVLVAGQAMGIFPEGKSTDQAHLEMVRSGAARMAIQASEEGAAGLLVVPIGITYERKDLFRSSALIQIAEPIDVGECLQQHEGNTRKARRALTQELESRLKDVVVHLDEPEWEPWLGDLEILAESPREAGREPVPPLLRRKRIADAMNHFLANDRERAESIAGKIKDYREQVETAGLRIDSPVLRMHGLRVLAELLWELLCLILLFIPAFVGTLQHLVPFVMVRAVAARLDQAGRKTVSTNRMLVGLPIYLLWYAVVAWWMIDYQFAAWFKWGWLIAAPSCGIIAVHYWRRAKRVALLLWHQLQVTVRRETLCRLRDQGTELRKQIGELAEDYAKIVPRPETKSLPTSRRAWRRIAGRLSVVLLIAAAILFSRYLLFDVPLSRGGLDLNAMQPARVEELLSTDEQQIAHLIDGLDELEADAIQVQREFADGHRSFSNQKDNDDVRELMRRFLTYQRALMRIVWRYQQYSVIENEELRLRTFLLDFTAGAALYQNSLQFIHQFGDSTTAVAKLNEAEPNWGIPPDLYDSIRLDLASPQNIKMFESARQYYHQDQVQTLFGKYGLSGKPPYDRFHAAISEAEQTIQKHGDSVPERIVKVAAADLGKLFRDVQYETQSAVSTWIGDFKIRQPHMGKPLIDKQQLAKLADMLQPGDILLERRNWYLSNAFLPGYWPHGAVYVGTTEDLRRLGLDENEYVRKHWDEFAAKDHAGHEHVIIEAVSEGVIFSSLEHSIGGADSVAVLRPNVSDEEKNEAIARAFSFAGRPYDFEFDFETTDKLVCTEVVFRAYGGNAGPIDFPLVRIMGRETMPAINLVEKFNEEYGSDDAQFEFIAFIDGDEQTETSRFLTDVEAFRETANRPASSFLQGSDPFALKGIGPLGWVLLSLTILAAIALLVPQLNRRIPAKTVD